MQAEAVEAVPTKCSLCWQWQSKYLLCSEADTGDCTDTNVAMPDHASGLDLMVYLGCVDPVDSCRSSCRFFVVAPAFALAGFPCHLLVRASWLKETFLRINIFGQIRSLTATRRNNPDYSLSESFFPVCSASCFNSQLDVTHGKQWKHLAGNSRGKSASSEVLNCLKPIIKSHSQLTRVHCVRYGAHC